MTKSKNENFSFEISLSVLDHLGRNLYRSFVTVLGEAISNSWDADARNVRIYIDKSKNSFVIIDDGDGMTSDDFQNKFLRIGYSKRKNGSSMSKNQRPFIGRKGIGKLALLSCADEITIASKVKGGSYVGGVINNKGLDKAITDDRAPQEYELGVLDVVKLKKFTNKHKKGTVLYFKGLKDEIKNNIDYLKKIVALYFRFSLLDSTFNIFINDEKITYKHLNDLSKKTEFLWETDGNKDPFVRQGLKFLKEEKRIKIGSGINGFIASVDKPRDLNVLSTGERVSIDLFVNGRLREKDILKHIPTARIAESYLYGQIHFDNLDDNDKDRFTSSRENVVADDPKYKEFLVEFKKTIEGVIKDWDTWRIKNRKDGNPENEDILKRDRKSLELYNVVSGEYIPPKGSAKKSLIDEWVDSLANDAKYNFSSYAECFISENLIRKYIGNKKIKMTEEAEREIKKWKDIEKQNKGAGNISIKIRNSETGLGYLSMTDLSALVDKKGRDKLKEASLFRDATEYKPIRDALAHTALLTDAAKSKLTSVYNNIKERVNVLISK
ncbi:MAG: ATP-binding protein [Candidatus Falkowbacteria bacterium]|nr:MAG: ATP-binding protein [Candidatus Falkowbacteria bacterium]